MRDEKRFFGENDVVTKIFLTHPKNWHKKPYKTELGAPNKILPTFFFFLFVCLFLHPFVHSFPISKMEVVVDSSASLRREHVLLSELQEAASSNLKGKLFTLLLGLFFEDSPTPTTTTPTHKSTFLPQEFMCSQQEEEVRCGKESSFLGLLMLLYKCVCVGGNVMSAP